MIKREQRFNCLWGNPALNDHYAGFSGIPLVMIRPWRKNIAFVPYPFWTAMMFTVRHNPSSLSEIQKLLSHHSTHLYPLTLQNELSDYGPQPVTQQVAEALVFATVAVRRGTNKNTKVDLKELLGRYDLTPTAYHVYACEASKMKRGRLHDDGKSVLLLHLVGNHKKIAMGGRVPPPNKAKITERWFGGPSKTYDQTEGCSSVKYWHSSEESEDREAVQLKPGKAVFLRARMLHRVSFHSEQNSCLDTNLSLSITVQFNRITPRPQLPLPPSNVDESLCESR